VCYQTCEQVILKTNEPILMQIGTCGLCGKAVKRIDFGGQVDNGQCHTVPKWVTKIHFGEIFQELSNEF